MTGNIENSPKWVGPLVQSMELPDPNLLTELSPWDLRYHQIEPGRIKVDIAMLAGNMLNVLEFKSNLGLHQLGGGPVGAVTMGIPISGDLPKWRQNDVSPGTLLSFGTGTEFEGISRGAFHGLTFSLPEEKHDILCDRLGMPNTDRIRNFGLLSMNSPSPRRDHLAQMVLGLLSSDTPNFTHQTEDEIASDLLISMTDGNPKLEDRSTPASRTKARRRAIDVMHHFAPKAARISEICAESGVGWRTLDRAFLEFFGFGPKTYYKILRLSRVRDELVASGPETTVAYAANRWGFGHMSQFTQDYRLLFHELPTETKSRGKWGLGL